LLGTITPAAANAWNAGAGLMGGVRGWSGSTRRLTPNSTTVPSFRKNGAR
jgi:hypothetical protein